MIKKELKELTTLLRNIPSAVLALFVVSVVAMNLLANKSINLPISWMALDCGIIVSWISFLSMDMIAKHFGAKASFEVSMVATAFNLLLCGVFFIASKIPGAWGESYVEVGGELINSALDNTFGGVWYVILGSTIAFIVSALVNAITNGIIGKMMKKDTYGAFICRSYISTVLAQVVDNLTFALIVSHVFFGWSLIQCITCSLIGAVVELVGEVLLSGVGYKVCKNWKNESVGSDYLNLISK